MKQRFLTVILVGIMFAACTKNVKTEAPSEKSCSSYLQVQKVNVKRFSREGGALTLELTRSLSQKEIIRGELLLFLSDQRERKALLIFQPGEKPKTASAEIRLSEIGMTVPVGAEMALMIGLVSCPGQPPNFTQFDIPLS